MNFKQKILRIIRNALYKRYKKAGQRFRKANRALLRATSDEAKPIKKAPVVTSRRTGDQWKKLQPVWVLSTGRTGTHSLTELLALSPRLDVRHEPTPELFDFSYDYYKKKCERPEALQALQYLRDEIVFRTARDGMVYVETNNRLTFIADLLLELYPQSKFIYIYRNPYDFVRSGMRRKYYDGHLRDAARITPNPSDAYATQWSGFTEIEKTAWNWATTNAFSLQFMEELPDTQKLQFSSEELFAADLSFMHHLFDFVGSNYCPPETDIRRVMGQKHNAQQKGVFKKPKNWSDAKIAQVNAIIQPVVSQLGYALLDDNQKR